MFFDKSPVLKAVDAAARSAFSKAGAFIRQTAKSSIRKRKKVSQPGQPPSSHEGSLRGKIYFGYDAGKKSVVVGPARYKNGTAPNVLEFGGSVRREDHKGRAFNARYKPRPFMGPALTAGISKGTIPSAW